MRIAFFGDRERSPRLHRRSAQPLQADDVGMRADAAGGDQRNLSLDACAAQEGQGLGGHVLEIEARVVQVGSIWGQKPESDFMVTIGRTLRDCLDGAAQPHAAHMDLSHVRQRRFPGRSPVAAAMGCAFSVRRCSAAW